MILAPAEPISTSPAGQSYPNVVEDRHMVEFGLQGLALVHLHNPAPRDVAAFRERLGPPLKFTNRAPEVCFRFVERLPLPPTACLVGEDTAFTPEQFYLRRPRSKDRALACLPMNLLGVGGEVVLESGTQLSMFEEIINLCVLQRGGLPLHASTFQFEGRGCVVGGWPHGGKTAVLIGMIAAGAKFVSDDWSYIHPGGEQVSGLPGPIEVRARYLREAPELLARVPGGGRTRATVLRAGAGAARLAGRMASPARRPAARVEQALEERQKLSLDPHTLFGPNGCLPNTRLDNYVLCVASGEPGVVVRPMSLTEAVQRTLASLEYERRKIRAYYLQFQFALPGRENTLLEQATALEEQRLRKALDGRGLFLLQHPPLASPGALAKALTPLLSNASIQRPGEKAE